MQRLRLRYKLLSLRYGGRLLLSPLDAAALLLEFKRELWSLILLQYLLPLLSLKINPGYNRTLK